MYPGEENVQKADVFNFERCGTVGNGPDSLRTGGYPCG
jgi:hypothetical protein